MLTGENAKTMKKTFRTHTHTTLLKEEKDESMDDGLWSYFPLMTCDALKRLETVEDCALCTFFQPPPPFLCLVLVGCPFPYATTPPCLLSQCPLLQYHHCNWAIPCSSGIYISSTSLKLFFFFFISSYFVLYYY